MDCVLAQYTVIHFCKTTMDETTNSSTTTIVLAIGTFLSSIIRAAEGRESFWFQVYRHEKDQPENRSLPDRLLGRQELNKRKSQLKKLCLLSLSRLMGLDYDEFKHALQKSKVLVMSTNRWGKKLRLGPKHFVQ